MQNKGGFFFFFFLCSPSKLLSSLVFCGVGELWCALSSSLSPALLCSAERGNKERAEKKEASLCLSYTHTPVIHHKDLQIAEPPTPPLPLLLPLYTPPLQNPAWTHSHSWDPPVIPPRLTSPNIFLFFFFATSPTYPFFFSRRFASKAKKKKKNLSESPNLHDTLQTPSRGRGCREKRHAHMENPPGEKESQHQGGNENAASEGPNTELTEPQIC